MVITIRCFDVSPMLITKKPIVDTQKIKHKKSKHTGGNNLITKNNSERKEQRGYKMTR